MGFYIMIISAVIAVTSIVIEKSRLKSKPQDKGHINLMILGICLITFAIVSHVAAMIFAKIH